MTLPPMMWAILVLGVLFLVLRIWAGRAEERRRAEHDARMAKLLAEREPRDAGPSSLAATTSDAPPPAGAIKVRCRACKALNDESATTCGECGAEL